MIQATRPSLLDGPLSELQKQELFGFLRAYFKSPGHAATLVKLLAMIPSDPLDLDTLEAYIDKRLREMREEIKAELKAELLADPKSGTKKK